jgi:excisionase family DNA binding protein
MTDKSVVRAPGEQKAGRSRIAPCAAHDDREPSRSGRMARRRRSQEQIRFFTVAEVAECVDVSTRSVRRWIKSGDLIAHHFGGAVRIAESDFRAFLAIHRAG